MSVRQHQGRPLPPPPEPDRKPRRDRNTAAASAAAGEGDDVVPLWAGREQRRIVAVGTRAEPLRPPPPQVERLADQVELGQSFVGTADNRLQRRIRQFSEQPSPRLVIDRAAVVGVDQREAQSSVPW